MPALAQLSRITFRDLCHDMRCYKTKDRDYNIMNVVRHLCVKLAGSLSLVVPVLSCTRGKSGRVKHSSARYEGLLDAPAQEMIMCPSAVNLYVGKSRRGRI